MAENNETKKLRPTYGYYQVTVVINMEDPETGKAKKQKEIHLVDAVNPTDAEKKIAAEMDGTMWEWEITNMSRSKIQVVY